MRRILSMVLCLAVAAGVWAAAVDSAHSQKQQSLRIGYSDRLFLDVKQADALAAIKVWVEALKQRWNPDVSSQISIYDDLEHMKVQLQEGKLDLVNMMTEDFFRIESEVELDQFHFGAFDGDITVENVLLVRCDSGLENLNDLAGTVFVSSIRDRLGMGDLWIDTLMMQKGYAEPADFFKRVESKDKASGAVLSVFFEKNDVCMVTRRTYRTIVELNPQVGRELKIIAQSPKLVPALACMRASYDQDSRQELLVALRDLHTEAGGRQLLSAWKSDQILPGTVEDLESTRALVALNTALRKKRGHAEVSK